MIEPNEQQIALMRKHRLNPNNWLVLEETDKKLVLITRRKTMRRVLEKESSHAGSVRKQ